MAQMTGGDRHLEIGRLGHLAVSEAVERLIAEVDRELSRKAIYLRPMVHSLFMIGHCPLPPPVVLTCGQPRSSLPTPSHNYHLTIIRNPTKFLLLHNPSQKLGSFLPQVSPVQRARQLVPSMASQRLAVRHQSPRLCFHQRSGVVQYSVHYVVV